MTINRMYYLLASLVLSAGCAIETDSPPTPEFDPALVHRTVVTLSADGHETAVQGFVHRDLERSLALGSRPGVTTSSFGQDLGCAGSSLWVYSDLDEVGAEICFQGIGTVNLGAYRYPKWDKASASWVGVRWAGSVRSYWPGENPGGFTNSTCSGWFCAEERFLAYGPPVTAGSTARGADTVCLGSSC